MLEQDYIKALEQIRLGDSARQRIIAACAENALKPAPRRRFAPILACAAALALLLIGGAVLLPRSIMPGHSFTIMAYAMSGDKTQSAVLGTKATEFSFKADIIETGLDRKESYTAGVLFLGGGDIREPIRFQCEGEGIESITYSAEGCRFLESIVLYDKEKYLDRNGSSAIDLYLEENIISITWPFDEYGRPWPQGQAIRDLGQSYTVAYTEQNTADYQISYPVQGMRKEDYDGSSPILIVQESALPSGVLHSKSYVPPTVTWYYTAKKACITVAVNFTNGTTESKSMLLSLKPSKTENWCLMSVELIEP